MKRHTAAGFTIVEMMTVIVILGILASVTVFMFGNWQMRMAENELKSDLRMAATAMDSVKNFSDETPTTIPSRYSPSENIVIEPTAAPARQYCLNGYHVKYPALRMSVRSGSTSAGTGLCPWPGTGNVVGGTIPPAPQGVNLAYEFRDWTPTGTTTYDASTGQVTMGTNGTLVSPVTRVNGAATIAIDGQFYATVQSANTGVLPDGAWHINIAYLDSDGVTPRANTSGATGNGCARKVKLGSWNASFNGACYFNLGNGIEYVKVTLYSSASGWASSDLQIKSPSFITG